MEKIKFIYILGICVLCMSFLAACRNSGRLRVSLDDSVFTIAQEGNKVMLYILNESCIEKKKVKITEVEDGAPVPVNMFQISKTELMVLVGNNNGEPVKVYQFKADEGELQKQGEIQTDNTDCVIYKDKIYTYSYDNTEKHKYWINIFSLENLKLEDKIEIAYAPKKMVVSEDENAIYFLLVGDKDVTQISKYLIDDKKMKNIIVDAKSFGSDIMFSKERLYVSLEGYSENNEVTHDNRVIVYNKDLEQEDTLITQRSPKCFTTDNHKIYIVSNDDRSSLQVLSLQDKKVEEELIIDNSYKAIAIHVKNNVIYIATRNKIYVKENNKILNLNINGEINCLLLSK